VNFVAAFPTEINEQRRAVPKRMVAREATLMDTTTLVIVIVIAVAVLVGGGLYLRFQRSRKLKSKFGPEYLRAVDETGGKRRAEAELHGREKRVKTFDIRPLSPQEIERFGTAWRAVQAEFVDNPKLAIARADTLLGELMGARGYPVSDFEQRAADLSVEHPHLVDNYRTAHEVALREGRGQANTEDLRQAMIHYRELFEDLAGEPEIEARRAAS
jgi:hypothetical protein